ncbi:MAG: SAM-dependent chlorinase/fluorinase [Candidatus Krumholzibacteriota bacterium]|nr:SAM-dependent chlorinase/fluorinase [Candidatus Krumholzibacteriota bacterium]
MPENKRIEKRIIAVLTDFGTGSWYPGVMKGVILGINPEAVVIDLCHDISHGDISEGGFVLGASFNYFPPGTVFLCVVDPGVGGDRKNIIVQTEDYLFVAPDNGLITRVCERSRIEGIFSVKQGRVAEKRRGATFLGRDLFAPLAAHLSLGVNPDEIGESIPSILTIPREEPFINKNNEISGRVVHVDTFGNIITNISADYLRELFGGTIPRKECVIKAAGRETKGLKRYYAEGETGELIALENSWGYIEIAVNGGSAYEYLGYEDKESIEVYLFSLRLPDKGVK